MMYSKIKYAISVYGLTSLENINKIQVLQINCQRFSHLKTTDTQQIQRIHIAWRMRRQVSTVIFIFLENFNTNGFNFSGSVQHVFWCSYDMLVFLTFDRGSVISYKAITKFLVFLEEKKIHNITTISLS